MFTGIVTAIGRIRARGHAASGARLEIETPDGFGEVPPGTSIACSGACLTATDAGGDWFAADVSAETLARTTIGEWQVGRRVNLERGLRMGDELGGHLVTGHVDGAIRILDARREGVSLRLDCELPAWLAPFVAPKGAVALDGVSLTVNAVHAERFGVNIVPYTQAATTLDAPRAGDRVNVEIDLLARYVARALAAAGRRAAVA